MLIRTTIAGAVVCIALLTACSSTGTAGSPPSATPTQPGPATPATTASTRVPPSRASSSATQIVSASDPLTIVGIGGLTIGMSRDALIASKAMLPTPESPCEGRLNTSDALQSQGITLSDYPTGLGEVWLTTAAHSTKSGARVGMTMKQIRAVYRADVTKKTLTYGATMPRKVDVYVFVAQGNIIIFKADTERATDSDVVTSIVLKKNDGYGIADDDAC